jgi:Mycothiol maleylpyruvate isomerase N-terminal domain
MSRCAPAEPANAVATQDVAGDGHQREPWIPISGTDLRSLVVAGTTRSPTLVRPVHPGVPDARTDRPGWSMQDALSHVIGIDRLLEGLPAADAVPDDVPPYVDNPIGEFNEREVAGQRPSTPSIA